MKRSPTLKDRKRFRTVVRHRPRGNPDQKWFKSNPNRQYRIRPNRHDEPGTGYLILKQLYPGRRHIVSIGPEGAMLADTDNVLGQVYDILCSGKAGIIFPHDGSVLCEDELES
jgi:hypothetical protein